MIWMGLPSIKSAVNIAQSSAVYKLTLFHQTFILASNGVVNSVGLTINEVKQGGLY